MTYFFIGGVLLLLAGYGYLFSMGIKTRKRLDALSQGQLPSQNTQSACRFEQGFVELLFSSIRRNTFQGTDPHTPENNQGCSNSTLNITSEFVGYVRSFIQQVSGERTIPLTTIDAEECLTFRESLELLRVIYQLVQKHKADELELRSVFLLCARPFQLSVEAINKKSIADSSIYSLVTKELQQSSLQIIHSETSALLDRLVIGTAEDDEDISSRRPRNFQRKH